MTEKTVKMQGGDEVSFVDPHTLDPIPDVKARRARDDENESEFVVPKDMIEGKK